MPLYRRRLLIKNNARHAQYAIAATFSVSPRSARRRAIRLLFARCRQFDTIKATNFHLTPRYHVAGMPIYDYPHRHAFEDCATARALASKQAR